MFSALTSTAENIRSLVAQGGMLSVLVIFGLVVAWIVIVATLLGACARAVHRKSRGQLILACVVLVCMFLMAEVSVFAVGAMLGDGNTEEKQP